MTNEAEKPEATADQAAPVDALVMRVLRFVQMVSDGGARTPNGTQFVWATWFWSDDYRPENSVRSVLPGEWSELKARAYMRLLGRFGLISGCHCGCRGDYVLTEKAKRLIGA